MADLWKDGDVITAKKLNRIVIANATTEDGSIYTLDITPNDVFDENNEPIDLIVIKFITEYIVIYKLVNVASYDTINEYVIVTHSPMDDTEMDFMASSRSDYFTGSVTTLK